MLVVLIVLTQIRNIPGVGEALQALQNVLESMREIGASMEAPTEKVTAE